MIQPGTPAAIADMHISQFGNTTRIEQGKPASISPKDHMERLEKIADMLYWNQNEIDACNEKLTSGKWELFGFDFFNPVMLRKHLVLLYHQQTRIKRIWNQQCEKMKL